MAVTSQALKWNLHNGQFLIEPIKPDKNGQGTFSPCASGVLSSQLLFLGIWAAVGRGASSPDCSLPCKGGWTPTECQPECELLGTLSSTAPTLFLPVQQPASPCPSSAPQSCSASREPHSQPTRLQTDAASGLGS